ncbi:MAG TPA: hypothetical protein VF071_03460 [Candidatus Limnocylindria bacterium]
MDRLLQIWTDDEVEALDEVYDEGMLLVTGWGAHSTLEEIAATLPSIPNTYTRVSGVMVTTEQVPGLWSMRRGSRYLHCVAEIHAQLFDVVLEVSDADRVVVHYGYEYMDPAIRVRDGFPSIPSPTAGPS